MDGNVAAMSLQERGAYITLLCICWQEKSLPSDLRRLANIVGLPVKGFQKIWPHLSECFVHQGERLLHPRLEKERDKQNQFSRRQADKAEARWNKPKPSPIDAGAHAEPIPKACSPSLRSPISDLQNNKNSLKHFDEEWEQFKAQYPGSGREGGYMASQRFLAACEKVGFPVLMAGLERYKRSKRVSDGYVIGMEKWLEKELWIQEPDAEPSASDDVAAMQAQLAKIDAERANRGR